MEDGDISRAMILALALNDYGLLRKVYEKARQELQLCSRCAGWAGGPVWQQHLPFPTRSNDPHREALGPKYSAHMLGDQILGVCIQSSRISAAKAGHCCSTTFLPSLQQLLELLSTHWPLRLHTQWSPKTWLIRDLSRQASSVWDFFWEHPLAL